MKGDPVLEEMANELREALMQRGFDPKHPPQESEAEPPTEPFFSEYKRRGGVVYNDPKQATKALIELVKSGSDA